MAKNETVRDSAIAAPAKHDAGGRQGNARKGISKLQNTTNGWQNVMTPRGFRRQCLSARASRPDLMPTT